MVISHNSQLGLRFREDEVKLPFLKLYQAYTESVLSLLQDAKGDRIDGSIDVTLPLDGDGEVWKLINVEGESLPYLDDNGRYYYICNSVYGAAELIRIKENFTGRTFKDMQCDKYTYLMGKNRMVRFSCTQDSIMGFYYDDLKAQMFEFGIERSSGKYYYGSGYDTEFAMVMQVLTFVELGDIEVLILQAGRNNGKARNDGKVTNTSEKTVYVVDSTWNKIMIRTDGFAVRGHFRLQPCGHNMADRKLIWIDAFEKHGYTRRPTAEIAR